MLMPYSVAWIASNSHKRTISPANPKKINPRKNLMPIILKPDTIVECTLPCERHKTEADRIVWLARALSCTDAIAYEADVLALFGMNSVAEQSKAANTLIRRISTGWKNLVDGEGKPVPFDDAAFDGFTIQQKLAIASQLPDAAGWSAYEKKV